MKKLLISVLTFMILILLLAAINSNSYAINNASFANKNVFCIEAIMDFKSVEFNKKLIYSDKEELQEFQSGLGYILSYDNEEYQRKPILNGSEFYDSYNDPVQLALWRYLYKYKSEAEKFFGKHNYELEEYFSYNPKKYDEKTGKEIKIKHDKIAIEGNQIYRYGMVRDYNLNEWATPDKDKANNKRAYIIFDNAEKIRKNKDKYEFDIDLYTNKDRSKRNSSKYSKKS